MFLASPLVIGIRKLLWCPFLALWYSTILHGYAQASKTTLYAEITISVLSIIITMFLRSDCAYLIVIFMYICLHKHCTSYTSCTWVVFLYKTILQAFIFDNYHALYQKCHSQLYIMTAPIYPFKSMSLYCHCVPHIICN